MLILGSRMEVNNVLFKLEFFVNLNILPEIFRCFFRGLSRRSSCFLSYVSIFSLVDGEALEEGGVCNYSRISLPSVRSYVSWFSLHLLTSEATSIHRFKLCIFYFCLVISFFALP